MENNHPEVTRTPFLAPKIVIVDGLPGCGKTMLSPIVSALERVELMNYAYEVEYACVLNYLGRIQPDATKTLVRAFTDLKLYNTMMGRETNFRFSDLSSAFKDRPCRYLKRIFQKGDEMIPERIKKEKPILNLTTHNLLGMSDPVFMALGNRVVVIEVVRHPLYMLKQQMLNMERLLANARHFTIYFKYQDQELPFWTWGWEECFVKSNALEKAIYMMEHWLKLAEDKTEKLKAEYGAQILVVPFEKFVIGPEPYLRKIEQLLETRVTAYTRRVMKKQKVPRKMYGEGIGLKIYKRCGWEPPQKGATEAEELSKHRQWAVRHSSPEAMAVLDKLCAEYEKKYLSSVDCH